MYKFKLAVNYDDEAAYDDLIQIAKRNNVSFAHKHESRTIIFYINESAILTLIVRDIQINVE